MARMLKFSLAALLLAIVPAAHAQMGSMVPEFGVKGGLNFSDINTDDLDASTRTGWGAGFYLDLATPLLHLQPEALLMSRGFDDASFTLNTSDVPLDYRRYDLEIPVLVALSLPVPAVSPRVFAGPALNIPLKSEIKLYDEWYDINDDTKTTWSVVLGAGVKLAQTIGVELRYDIGLSEFNDRPLGDIVDDISDEFSSDEQIGDLKNRTFSVMVSFALN